MKSVFIVSSRPPSEESAGAAPSANFIKHLPEFGWQPIIRAFSGERPVMGT